MRSKKCSIKIAPPVAKWALKQPRAEKIASGVSRYAIALNRQIRMSNLVLRSNRCIPRPGNCRRVVLRSRSSQTRARDRFRRLGIRVKAEGARRCRRQYPEWFARRAQIVEGGLADDRFLPGNPSYRKPSRNIQRKRKTQPAWYTNAHAFVYHAGYGRSSGKAGPFCCNLFQQRTFQFMVERIRQASLPSSDTDL